MNQRIELKTSKGGCLTPTLLVLFILGWMAWKIAHGETDGIRLGCSRETPTASP